MIKIIPTIALYLVMVILAVMAIMGSYGLLSVGLDYLFGIESCTYKFEGQECVAFDKERFVESLAMLIVSKPSLITLWFLRKKV